MAFRKLLCVLSGGPGDAAALGTAFALVRPVEGHVEALFVRTDPREAVPMVGEGVSGVLMHDILTAVEKENQTRSQTARAAFNTVRDQAGATLAEVPQGHHGCTAHFTEAEGLAEQVVVDLGRLSDAVVFPRVGAEQESSTLLALEAALLDSGRPLIVAPPTAPEAAGHRIAIAWNGSTEAVRAVAMALPILSKADQVTVLTAETPKTAAASGQALAAYLAWHGIDAAVRAVSPDGESVGAALLRTAANLRADMVVMGGYGHSRLREMILGGVTRHVLNATELPVLMAH
ncbi:universal stress protein [Oleisolibacter albus]|uniref:universal stress protein n=1 Tax=Oleisolibacter albus TaxID=2171757 RepID=UPI0013904F84|nr:universal stress protein [Oleisolibacter albus]